MSPSRRTLLGVAALMVVRLAWSIEALLFDPMRFTNHEETYNATVGWLVWQTGSIETLLRLQYRDFCGGCTVVSALAAPSLGLLGDLFFVWKGVAVLWGLATVAMAYLAGARLWGPRSGLAVAALLALPPGGLGELSLMLWGNHQESALLLMISLSLLRRGGVWLGVVLGLSLWFCRTGGYFVAVLLPLALSRPDRGRVLAGFAAGLAVLLIPAGAGASGQVSMSPLSHLMPEGPSGVARRLSLLLTPSGLSSRLFLVRGMEVWAGLVLCNALISSVALIWMRRWLPLLLAASFVGAFAISGFHVPLPGEVLPVVNARYHAPWLLLLLLLPAAAVVGRRSALLLVIPLAAGLAGRIDRPKWGPGHIPWQAPATNPWQFLTSGAVRLSPDVLSGDGEMTSLLYGYRGGDPAGQPLAMVGLGLTDAPPPSGLSAAELHPFHQARSAMVAIRGGRAEHDFGRGVAAARRCQRPNPQAFCGCIDKSQPSDEVLLGVGAAVADPWRSPADLAALSACLGPAFTAGLTHPLAGLATSVGRY